MLTNNSWTEINLCMIVSSSESCNTLESMYEEQLVYMTVVYLTKLLDMFQGLCVKKN